MSDVLTTLKISYNDLRKKNGMSYILFSQINLIKYITFWHWSTKKLRRILAPVPAWFFYYI